VAHDSSADFGKFQLGIPTTSGAALKIDEVIVSIEFDHCTPMARAIFLSGTARSWPPLRASAATTLRSVRQAIRSRSKANSRL
jgi:hypothetical protein